MSDEQDIQKDRIEKMKGKKLLKKQHKKIPRLEIPQILASY
jgi:hypothetical protein